MKNKLQIKTLADAKYNTFMIEVYIENTDLIITRLFFKEGVNEKQSMQDIKEFVKNNCKLNTREFKQVEKRLSNAYGKLFNKVVEIGKAKLLKEAKTL